MVDLDDYLLVEETNQNRPAMRITIGVLIAKGIAHKAISREFMIWLNCYEYQGEQVVDENLANWILADTKAWCAANPASVYSMFPWSYLSNTQDRLVGICSYFTLSEQAAILKQIEGEKTATLPG